MPVVCSNIHAYVSTEQDNHPLQTHFNTFTARFIATKEKGRKKKIQNKAIGSSTKFLVYGC